MGGVLKRNACPGGFKIRRRREIKLPEHQEMKPPYNPIRYHAFCCGVSCGLFVILLFTTCLLFAYGLIIPACIGWGLTLLALAFTLHHRN